MGPIFNLTLRQLAGQRRIAVVLLLAATPTVVAIIYRIFSTEVDASEFTAGIISHLTVSLVLPISVLITGTMALGNEIEDRTLSYLVLKPIPRWQIALPKLVAAFVVGGLPVTVSAAAALLVMPGGTIPDALGVAAAMVAGAAAYAAVFLLAGMLTQHALAFGIVYVVIWEGTVAQFLAGVKYLSIRQYTLTIIDWLAPDRLGTLGFTLVERPAALIGVGAVIAAAFALAVNRLRTMDFD